MLQSVFRNALALALVLAASISGAQVFDVNGQSSPNGAQTGKTHHGPTSRQEPSASGMGWGSGIGVAREARAAQMALQHGNPKEAVVHAQHAVDAAPQNSDLWFTLAYAARLSGEYSKAVDAYQRGLALKPASVQGLSGLAQTYALMGKSAEAQQTLQKVLGANPKSETDLQLAGELLLSTDPKRAIEYLQRAETIRRSWRNELLLARAYDRTGDKQSALGMLERARRSSPSNPEVLRAIAAYYRDTNNYEAAVRTLERVHSNDPNIFAELGYSYSLAGNTRAAARSYSEAASRAPKNIDMQLGAAQAMLNAGEFSKANALLNHAATLNPDHYRVYALRGRLDVGQHENQAAAKEYEAALQHLPESVPEGVLYPISLRVDLAGVYRDEGDTADAERVIKDAANAISAIDLQGTERPEFLRLRAVVELAEGQPDSAEKDLQQALQIEPRNVVLLLNYADLLRKTKRKEEARKKYLEALAVDSSNPSALGSLGFLSREMGDPEAARRYFHEYAKAHPEDYVPYLALGDMDSENHDFDEAEKNYRQAFKLAPDHPLIVSGAMNAALEAHHFPEAKRWLADSPADMRENPQVMREHERYLTMTGNYAESADLGYQVIEKLPNDREGVDYLAYDLLFLKRFDDAMKIVEQYQPVLQNDRDLPLISGYVNAHNHEYEAAVRDFTQALAVDPKMAVGYMNRGYVYNDMRLASKAEADFREALKLNPQYGEARLGLAYALVQLRRPTPALKEAELAMRLLPESASLHLVKAEAYRQRAMLSRAESEYESALKFDPNSVTTYIALNDVQYRAREYAESAATLQKALTIAPADAMLQAQLGRSYARLGRGDAAVQEIASAERAGGGDYKVLLVAADAMRIMNRRDQSMTIYARALETSDEDRLQVRLALAQLFAEEGKPADAEEQVAMGFAEARVASTDVTTADDYLNAASIMMGIHEYTLAQRLYGRAEALGADQTLVAVGMANAALALGETQNAQLQLASVHDDPDLKNNYDYLVSQGNVYRQLGQNDLALADFVHAHQLNPDDPAIQDAETELAEEVGRPVTDHLGISSDVRADPVFEDDNVYQLDARLLGVQNNASLLPLPRHSLETYAQSRFQFRPDSFPPIQGFVAERNAQGTFSFPSELLIQDRNTLDTIFNISVAPMVKLGDVKFSIMPGLQYTIRRDTLVPAGLNQNLFRQFVYVASSPIGDWLSFSGNLIREAGPFTEHPLHSRDFSGALDFRVGRPWGKTALLAGYTGRNVLFSPNVHNDRAVVEDYETSSYAGLEHQFGSRIRVSAVAEFLRGWRIENLEYATAQTLRPRFSLDAKIRRNWALSATGAWSSGRNFHAYDSVTSNVEVTYTRDQGWGRSSEGSVPYPLTLSFGLGQQSFYDFPGHAHTQVVPIAQFNF